MKLSQQAIDDVVAERQRQINQEGWSASHDDEHEPGELAAAAANYALNASCQLSPYDGTSCERPPIEHAWPEWLADPPRPWTWKPKDARRDLVRAAALIIAEIERFDRAAKPPHHEGSST